MRHSDFSVFRFCGVCIIKLETDTMARAVGVTTLCQDGETLFYLLAMLAFICSHCARDFLHQQSDPFILTLLSHMEKRAVDAGTVLIQEGDVDATEMYILYQGAVAIEQGSNVVAEVLSTPRTPQHFGELYVARYTVLVCCYLSLHCIPLLLNRSDRSSQAVPVRRLCEHFRT